MKEYAIDFEPAAEGLACQPEAAYQANRELNLAWQIVEETGANLFLTGRAGTGKTTFLRKLRETSAKQMVVLAPTGVAAINAKGNTIHSFFQLPFAPYIPGRGFISGEKRYLNISKMKRRLISSLSLLVIDEISMVRPDTLDAIDSMLRRLRNSGLPFGGIQLLLIGDLRQLPPVVRNDEWELLKETYPTPYFFESLALRKAGFKTVELSVVYRQSDAAFLDILNGIRDGKADVNTLNALNRRCMPGFTPDDSEGYIRLTTHNRSAAAINDSRLASIPEALYSFEAEIEGDFPEAAFPADRALHLKKGAQVMFLKNDSGTNRRFYNGLIGTVTDISDDRICVRPSTGEDVIEVEKAEWDNTRYIIDEETKTVTQDTTGVFRQYPLQLAWAITIHKSQGLTFDKAIIDAAHSFAAGQTYVALSRCRSLEGIVLDSPIYPGAIITDSDVNDFITGCERSALDSPALDRLKNEYLFTLLFELFDFEPLRRSYADFHRQAREYIAPRHLELEDSMEEWNGRIVKELCDVGHKFAGAYKGADLGAALSAPESKLTARIKKGAEYFLNILDDLEAFMAGMPGDIGNRTHAERLNNTFENLIHLLEMKKLLFQAHRDSDFSLQSYIRAKSRTSLTLDMPRRFSAQRKAARKRTPKG